MNDGPLLCAPFYLLHADDGRLAIWARQIPHLIARDLAAQGGRVLYRPIIEGSAERTHYRMLDRFDPQTLGLLAKASGAARVVTAGIGFHPEVTLHVQAFDAATGSPLSESVDRCAPALLMAVLPRVYRHIAGLAGIRGDGVPPFLGAGRSETALYALALDLDNDDLLTAADGKLPFADPFSARYLPLLEALRLDPSFSEARERLEERCRTAPPEETDIAVRSLQRALEFADRPWELSLELALLLEGKKRLPEAVEALENGLEANPGHIESRYNYGRLLMLSGHSQRAAPHLAEAADVRPHDWRPAFWLGRLYRESGDEQGAVRWWTRALANGMPEGPQRKRAENAIQRSG